MEKMKVGIIGATGYVGTDEEDHSYNVNGDLAA